MDGISGLLIQMSLWSLQPEETTADIQTIVHVVTNSDSLQYKKEENCKYLDRYYSLQTFSVGRSTILFDFQWFHNFLHILMYLTKLIRTHLTNKKY